MIFDNYTIIIKNDNINHISPYINELPVRIPLFLFIMTCYHIFVRATKFTYTHLSKGTVNCSYFDHLIQVSYSEVTIVLYFHQFYLLI